MTVTATTAAVTAVAIAAVANGGAASRDTPHPLPLAAATATAASASAAAAAVAAAATTAAGWPPPCLCRPMRRPMKSLLVLLGVGAAVTAALALGAATPSAATSAAATSREGGAARLPPFPRRTPRPCATYRFPSACVARRAAAAAHAANRRACAAAARSTLRRFTRDFIRHGCMASGCVPNEAVAMSTRTLLVGLAWRRVCPSRLEQRTLAKNILYLGSKSTCLSQRVPYGRHAGAQRVSRKRKGMAPVAAIVRAAPPVPLASPPSPPLSSLLPHAARQRHRTWAVDFRNPPALPPPRRCCGRRVAYPTAAAPTVCCDPFCFNAPDYFAFLFSVDTCCNLDLATHPPRRVCPRQSG